MVDKTQLQPLTSRELSDVTDLLTIEELLVKKYTQAASQLSELKLQQFCLDMAKRHEDHYQRLFQSLQQHHPNPVQ